MLTSSEIEGYRLFSGLSSNELAKVAKLCTRKTYEAGAMIYGHDLVATDMFLLEDGNDAVHIEVPISSDADKVVIHTIAKGEAFGWAVLWKPLLRSTTARCVDKVSIICINGESLLRLFDAEHGIGCVVMKNLAQIINSRLSYTILAFRNAIRKTSIKPA
jgi:glutaminase